MPQHRKSPIGLKTERSQWRRRWQMAVQARAVQTREFQGEALRHPCSSHLLCQPTIPFHRQAELGMHSHWPMLAARINSHWPAGTRWIEVAAVHFAASVWATTQEAQVGPLPQVPVLLGSHQCTHKRRGLPCPTPIRPTSPGQHIFAFDIREIRFLATKSCGESAGKPGWPASSRCYGTMDQPILPNRASSLSRRSSSLDGMRPAANDHEAGPK